jgi:hypothetical protein
MSDAVLVALIAAVGSLLTGIFTLATLVLVNVLIGRLKETHNLVNSKMTELLAANAAQAHAEGVLTGEQSQRDRQSSPAP